ADHIALVDASGSTARPAERAQVAQATRRGLESAHANDPRFATRGAGPARRDIGLADHDPGVADAAGRAVATRICRRRELRGSQYGNCDQRNERKQVCHSLVHAGSLLQSASDRRWQVRPGSTEQYHATGEAQFFSGTLTAARERPSWRGCTRPADWVLWGT